MNVITRFAPSPTGDMHIGNARIAFLNWLFTKKFNGTFILRIDDTDLSRSKEMFVESILEDLKWLKIDFDIQFSQSTHKNRYKEIFQTLLKKGLIYPCYETLEEINLKKQTLIRKKLPPIYDRSSLFLTEQEKLYYIQKGQKPYFRFLLSRKKHFWNDVLKGKLFYDTSNISDPVILKENGEFTYLLSSVIDDIDFGVTHIFRGEDHITNTAVQIEIFQSLQSNLPKFGHTGLVHFDSGKISKRTGGFNIKFIKENLIEQISVSNFLFKSLLPSEDFFLNLDSMIKYFDLSKISSKKLIVDLNDLKNLNSKLFSQMNLVQINEKLLNSNIAIQIKEKFWLLIKDNVNNVLEVKRWYALIYEDFIFTDIISNKEQSLLVEIGNTLPRTLDYVTWNQWLNNFITTFALNKKEFFFFLRKVLTGITTGPQLKEVCIFLGSQTILKRINSCLDRYQKE